MRQPSSPPVKRILLLRLEHIGDVVLVLPIIDALRLRYPEAKIDIAVGAWAEEAARLSQNIDDILIYNHPFFDRKNARPWWMQLPNYVRFVAGIRSRTYDMLIDFRSNLCTLAITCVSAARKTIGFNIGGRGVLLDETVPFDTSRHQLELNTDLARKAGVTAPLPPFKLSASEHDCDAVARVLCLPSTTAARPFIALYLSASSELRRWNILNFVHITEWLLENYAVNIVVVGSSGDGNDFESLYASLQSHHRERVVCAAGKTTLRQTGLLLSQCLLFVGVDSGPMHLATVLHVPVVCLMGPSRYPLYAPFGSNNAVVRNDVGCNPCTEYTRALCRRGTNVCMRSIRTEDVKEALRKILSRNHNC